MEVIKWLTRGLDAHTQLISLQEALKYIKNNQYYSKNKAGANIVKNKNNKNNSLFSRAGELEELIEDKTIQLKIIKLDTLTAIINISPLILQKILILKYVDFLTLDEIANKLNYSTRQVLRLHKLALQKIKPYIKS